MDMEQQRFCVRLAAYLALISCWFIVMDLLILRFGWKPILKEGGVVEWLQVGTQLAILLGCLWLAVRWTEFRWVFATMACLTFLAGFREFNDTAFVEYITEFKGLKESVSLALLLSIVIPKRKEVFPKLGGLFSRHGAALFIFGAFLTVFWAQPLGLRRAWEVLFEAPSRGKRMVEENLELAGYLLILCGVIEEILAYRRSSRRPGAGAAIVPSSETSSSRHRELTTASRPS